MTAYSVAAKRRARKAKQDLADAGMPALASSKKRQPNGEYRRANDRPADPRNTALEARCRQEGRGMTRQDKIAVSGALSGSAVGLCIREALTDDNGKKAWDAWCGYTAAMRNYERRILGKSVHAKTAKIEMEPERVETDDHHTVDDRDDDQKDRDAVNNWMRWKGYVWEIGHIASGLIEGARRDETGLWQDATPTKKGFAVAYALKELAKAVESR